jgi:CD109 antigen
MAQPVAQVASFSGGTGAITGAVTDASGAAVSGTKVTAKHSYSSLEFNAETNEEGVYLIRGLPSGFYTLTFDAQGFKRAVIEQVRVVSSNMTKVDVSIEAGGVSETVTVTAGRDEVVNASTSQTVVKDETAGGRVPLSTPRLREFFPETLVWSPELETARDGTASLKFKLADNITTWKMSVIASTEDGRLGTVEREFLAFQPFFVEHDPPRVLTEGDEISLPVVLRNYLARAQGVDVEMKPEPWFTLGGPARLREEVPAGEAARPAFDFRAVASVKDGRQRVTAFGADASDAVEKPVTVHPDGEERSLTDGTVFTDAAALVAHVPADAIRGSVRGELKLYPNLAAHLLEGVEAVMERPHGCGEQTISSTYPSVLVLGLYEKDAGREDLPPVVARARGYARLGYERLLGYRAAGGGFTYWGRGEPDLALTAYALRFLNDASRVIEVDADVLSETRAWLLRQQREDGSWPAPRWYTNAEERRQTALTTAFVARILAATQKADAASAAPAQTPAQNTSQTPGAAVPPSQATPLQRALRYLAPRVDEADEPYLVASFALAASDAGEAEAAARAVARLRALAREDGSGSYWESEGETPFHGWGLAGRIETTALAVQALNRYCGMRNAECGMKDDESRALINQPSSNRQSEIRIPKLIDRGLVYLLRNKDRYGVWHSTQATINVFDAMLSAAAPGRVSAQRRGAAATTAADTAEVFVNGRPAGRLALPVSDRATAPLTLDLSPFLDAGDNRVEVRRAGTARQAQAQLVTSFYVPWVAPKAGASDRGAAALRLSVGYDRASAGVNEEVTCSVEAGRVGGLGRGMLLAEVGLPPGADVDRASLDRAVEESGWTLSRYDVLPDRLVVYLWPHAGATRFRFKFRPRYGLNALTAPSQLYDYYNPEARTVVPPTRFVVR